MSLKPSRSRGGTGSCCGDCYIPHAAGEGECGGCAGCIPQMYCIVFEVDPGQEPDEVGCCQFFHQRVSVICGTGTYCGASFACPDKWSLSIAVYFERSEDQCCLIADVSNGIETITASVCAVDSEVSKTIEDAPIAIVISEYPEITLSGTLNVFPLTGDSNPGQYGNVLTGECPKCGPIKLNSDTDPEISPCNRPSLFTAEKTAIRTFGEDFEQQILDGFLKSDEFCWFLPPCKCLPQSLCLTYDYTNCCNEPSTIKTLLLRAEGSCIYGPVSFEVDRCGYDTDTVSVSGELTEFCTIIWRITSDEFSYENEFALNRMDVPCEEFSKRCDLEVAQTSIEVEGVTDSFSILDSCLCLPPHDPICPGSCYSIRHPIDTTTGPYGIPGCHLAIIEGSIDTCGDTGGITFRMWPQNYQTETGIVVLGGFGSQSELDACQKYDAYDSAGNRTILPMPTCQTVGPPGDPYFEDQQDSSVELTLVYPNDCVTEENPEIKPNQYELHYRVTNSCGNVGNTEEGIVRPNFVSCDPFQMVFTIPFNDITPCTCSCSSLTVRLSL